jgi:DNA-binding FadR family transcriptional regulator
MSVDPEHMLSLFEFRCTLEMETARLAARRITPRELRALEEALAVHRRMAESGQLDRIAREQMSAETPNPDRAFHVGIAEATHNEFFAATIASVLRLQSRAIELVLAGAPGSFLVAADQHDAVYEAIRLGHEDDAARAMQTHIQTVRAAYQQEVRRLLAGGLPVPD